VAAGAGTEPGVRDVPVPVTVRRVALVAESRVVVEARGVDLVVRQRLLERRRDLLCLRVRDTFIGMLDLGWSRL
jgi:hypothetical protein